VFVYNIDDYARKLFYKECFVHQDHFLIQDSHEIILKEYQKNNNNTKFRIFRPIVKLHLHKESLDSNWLQLKFIKKKAFGWVNHESPPLALRVVPLPGFTRHKIIRNTNHSFKRKILNIILFIFIPQWYQINKNDKKLLSPFSRVIQYENNNDIFDNPAIEAVINFCWQKTRIFFFIRFLRFLIFGLCFLYVSYSYMDHDVASNDHRNFLVALIAIFYHSAFYQLVTEVIQLNYRGWKKYLSFPHNTFDIFSTIVPMVVMSIMLNNAFQFSNGFGSVETVDTRLIVGISFSILMIWIEIVSLSMIILYNDNLYS